MSKPRFENFKLLTNEAELFYEMQNIDYDYPVAVDTETTDLVYDSELLGISMKPYKRDPFWIPIEGRLPGIPFSAVKRILDTYAHLIKGVYHNYKYDDFVFTKSNLKRIPLIFDTMLAVHLYDPNLKKNLETRVNEDFGVRKKKFEEIIGKKWNKIDWVADVESGLITNENLGEYACYDVWGTYLLYTKYGPLLETEKLLPILEKIENPLARILADMQARGVDVDLDLLASLEIEVDDKIEDLKTLIYRESDCEFNINSSKQKAEVLFDKMGLPATKTTPSGNRATDKETLEYLASIGEPIAQLMLDYSHLNKLQSGYIQAIPRLVDNDGRLRCYFNSEGARTGRMSSNNPNLQNQPNLKHNKDGTPMISRGIRNAFVAAPGRNKIVLDWSQIELRVMAHASKDPALVKAFMEGADIHQFVADQLDIPRKGAKVINFGVMYGMGPALLAKTLDISDAEAKGIVNNYEVTYAGYTRWKHQIERFAEKNGFVKNLFGRVRRLPEVNSRNPKQYYGALRKAVNTVIQGSAADLMKIGLLRIDEAFTAHPEYDAYLELIVHDEFVMDSLSPTAHSVYDHAKSIMENCVEFRVPIIAEGIVCDHWGQAKEEDYIFVPKTSIIEEMPWMLFPEWK